MQLIDIIKDWSFWEGFPETWEREIEVPPPANDLATVILGVRRSGKSTLMAQLADRWGLDPNQCFFVNFEDPRLSQNLTHGLLDDVVATVKEQAPNKSRYIFLDEIQAVGSWEKWIGTKLERPGEENFILSGSNSSLLSGEFSTTLTGRHKDYTVFPFSFSEFRRVFPDRSLEDYLETGGFPRILREESHRPLLHQYFYDITERDLRERLRAKSARPIQSLIISGFEAVGAELSLRKLAAVTDLTADTVSVYLRAAENAYLLFPCPFYATSEKKRSVRNKKYYAVDSGLRRSVVTRTGADLGKDFENLVFLDLKRRHREVFYWKGQREVDFVVETPEGVQPYQVSWDGIKERHEEALEEFYRAFPHAREPVYVTKETYGE